MLYPVFTSSLGLYQALQHAAAHAPEDDCTHTIEEFRPATPFDGPAEFTGFAKNWANGGLQRMRDDARPMMWLHGPQRHGVGKVTFCFTPSPGVRSSFSIIRTRPKLLAMAEQVRKHWALYGGGIKPAVDKPVKRAVTWSANVIKVWLSQIEDRDYAGAMLTAENIGARYYPGNRDSVIVLAAPIHVDGLPGGMCSVRRGDGRWVVADTRTGRSMESRGFGSRKAAEESAVAMWDGMDDDRRSNALHVIANHETADTAAARVAYCRAVGIDDPVLPQEPALEAPEPAPMSDCMAEILAVAALPCPAPVAVAVAPADDGGFNRRVNFAAAYIGAGRRTSRAFDSCFEMWDGSAVCVALLRRAEARPSGKLANNLYRYLAQHQVESAATQQPAGLSLVEWSRALIADHASTNAPPPAGPAAAQQATRKTPAPAPIACDYAPPITDSPHLSQAGQAAPAHHTPSSVIGTPPPAEAGIHPDVQKTQPDKPSALPDSGAVCLPQSERWRATRAGLMLRRWRYWRGAAPPPVESAATPPAEAGLGCTPWRAKDTMHWGLVKRPSSGGSLARRQVYARQGCGPPLARPSSPRLPHPFT